MDNKTKIINLFLRNPTTVYNINQISKTLKISIGSAHKIIKKLEKKELAKSIKLGNAIYYRLNFSNREVQELSELILLENKNLLFRENPTAKIYSLEINKIPAKVAILFGSVLIKKEKAEDVDVLFIVSQKENVKRIYEQCLELSKLKVKQIIPFILTEKDFKDKIEKREKIILSIIKEGIVLFGEKAFIKILDKIKWQM